jgi:hypothetical protein
MLTMTSDNFTVVITRELGGRFDIVSNDSPNAGKPAGWAMHSLDPFFQQTIATAFIINLSGPATAISLETGDYGSPGGLDFDNWYMDAYDATDLGGNLVDSQTGVYGNNAFTTIVTASVNGPGIRSVRLIGGSTNFVHSLFYDNFTIETDSGPTVPGIPEPATLVLTLSALVVGAGVRSRARR